MENIIIGVLGCVITYFGVNKEKYTDKQKSKQLRFIGLLILVAMVCIFVVSKDFLVTKMLIVNILQKVALDDGKGTFMDALVRRFKLILIAYIFSVLELGVLVLSYYAV